jgi:pyruvate kinase
VRSADDIRQLRKLIDHKHKVSIVAKIETKFAIENLEEIVAVADVIMVARGDLAIGNAFRKSAFVAKANYPHGQ